MGKRSRKRTGAAAAADVPSAGGTTRAERDAARARRAAAVRERGSAPDRAPRGCIHLRLVELEPLVRLAFVAESVDFGPAGYRVDGRLAGEPRVGHHPPDGDVGERLGPALGLQSDGAAGGPSLTPSRRRATLCGEHMFVPLPTLETRC